MEESYSHLYNAVILPAGERQAGQPTRYQVSASRNDRGTPRYVSPSWSLAELHQAFRTLGCTEVEFQELLRGNRRGAGGRKARRILFPADQLQSAGLTLDLPTQAAEVESGHPTVGEHAVFPSR